MKEPTKVYPWLPWAVALSIGLILFWGLKYVGLKWPIGIWEIAQSVDTIRAINEFGSGVLDMGPYREQRLIAFTGLILFFVLGPTLWIFGELHNEKRAVTKPEDRLKKGPFWYAGVILVVIGLNYAIPGAVMKAYYFNKTWQGAEENRNVDELRSRLYTLAFDAAEYYYLSFKDGENGGFINDQGTFSLQQLESYGNGTQNNYVLATVESDSVITIYGIGKVLGAKPEFENANGDIGKVQLAVEVRPEGKVVELSHKNTNYR
ncbi:MAG: hypothetical protein R3222_01240 [Balneolaceae bacterium]|nr:hypothetical protein [Balneolaceae bacterium]